MLNDKLGISIVVGIIALAAGCSPAEEYIPLENTNWQLVQLTVVGGFVFTPDDPAKYVLNFRSENRLTGTSDCNQLSGSWQQVEGSLTFVPFNAGRSLCPPGSLHNYLTLYLRDVTTHRFNEGQLFMNTDAEGVELQFATRE